MGKPGPALAHAVCSCWKGLSPQGSARAGKDVWVGLDLMCLLEAETPKVVCWSVLCWAPECLWWDHLLRAVKQGVLIQSEEDELQMGLLILYDTAIWF